VLGDYSGLHITMSGVSSLPVRLLMSNAPAPAVSIGALRAYDRAGAYGDPRLAGRGRPRPVRVASARLRARLVLRDLVKWAARWAVGDRSIGRWR
jgi:hypothetical protein